MKTLPYGGFVTRRKFTGPYPDLRHRFFYNRKTIFKRQEDGGTNLRILALGLLGLNLFISS